VAKPAKTATTVKKAVATKAVATKTVATKTVAKQVDDALGDAYGYFLVVFAGFTATAAATSTRRRWPAWPPSSRTRSRRATTSEPRSRSSTSPARPAKR